MRARWIVPIYLSAFLLTAASAHAQTASLRVQVLSSGHPAADASVVVNGVTHRTGADGVVSVSLPPGLINLVVVKEGLAPASASLDLAAGDTRTVTITLEPQSEMEEHVTVSATRTDKLAADEPLRVDVLDREEIEEKMMMTPGDITMMLNEMGGLRVQSTSPSLGAAGIRIQGMRSRYTRFLSDGLPLFGEQVSSFGLLQIPPADLGHIEMIKGVASSLYGAGAMAGVVNLVSKRPGAAPEHELLVNRSTRGATDGVLWYSAPISPTWGATLLAGAHGHQRTDVDGDGWADLPKYARGVVRPRVFWDNKAGGTFFATAGVTWEDRIGGTMRGAAPAAIGDTYVEALDTRRFDAGAVAQTLVAGKYVAVARGSFVSQRLEHRFGELTERDTHQTTFGELTLRGTAPHQTWVVGGALERDTFDPVDVPRFAFAYTVPGVFAQDEVDLATWLSISASARVDAHSEYGAFLSPRVSVLFKGEDWSSRVSLGSGFFAPTPLIEETEAAGLSRLTLPRRLTAERGESASVDFSGAAGGLRATVTVFASRVRDPLDVQRDTVFALVNRSSRTTNTGLDFVSSWRGGPFSVVAAYAYVRAREGDADVPLTPRHTAGIDWAWERPSTWRLGVEWYYTGAQRLEANPYRDESRPYTVFGVLMLRKLGRYRLFVNGENLTDVRQTHWDPLLRPARGVDGRWTVDAWAPLDGRNINAGVRIGF